MARRNGTVLLDLLDEADLERLNKLLEGSGVTFVHDLFGMPHAMVWPQESRGPGAPGGRGMDKAE